jgi:hypothetical protein
MSVSTVGDGGGQDVYGDDRASRWKSNGVGPVPLWDGSG